MDENGLAGLEEERRLAYVGITRGKKRVQISYAANRRTHGLWQSAIPSRFVSELPVAAIEIKEGGSAQLLHNAAPSPRTAGRPATSRPAMTAPAGGAPRPTPRAAASASAAR